MRDKIALDREVTKSDSHTNKQIMKQPSILKATNCTEGKESVAGWGHAEAEGGYDPTEEIRISFSEEVMLGLKSGWGVDM